MDPQRRQHRRLQRLSSVGQQGHARAASVLRRHEDARGLGEAPSGRAGWRRDEQPIQPGRPLARNRDVRELDRSGDGRRTADRRARASARERAQRCHHDVGLGRREDLCARRDLDRQTQSDRERQRPHLRRARRERRLHADGRPDTPCRWSGEIDGARSEDAERRQHAAAATVAVLGRGDHLEQPDQHAQLRDGSPGPDLGGIANPPERDAAVVPGRIGSSVSQGLSAHGQWPAARAVPIRRRSRPRPSTPASAPVT